MRNIFSLYNPEKQEQTNENNIEILLETLPSQRRVDITPQTRSEDENNNFEEDYNEIHQDNNNDSNKTKRGIVIDPVYFKIVWNKHKEWKGESLVSCLKDFPFLFLPVIWEDKL